MGGGVEAPLAPLPGYATAEVGEAVKCSH